MTPELLIARQARILGLRFEFDLVSFEEIERWADDAILSMGNPPFELIDVALARRKGRQETQSLLRRLGAGEPSGREMILALASADPDVLSYDQMHALVQRASGMAIGVGLIEEQRDDDLTLLLRAYEPYDCFYPAEQGELTQQQVIDAVKAYLKVVRDHVASDSFEGAIA